MNCLPTRIQVAEREIESAFGKDHVEFGACAMVTHSTFTFIQLDILGQTAGWYSGDAVTHH